LKYTLAPLAVIGLAVCSFAAGEGKWSPEAVSLPQFWDSDSKPMAVPSHGQRLVLRVQGQKTGKGYPDDEFAPEYFLQDGSNRLHPSIHTYAMPEALWSPNSRILALTSSDGGLVGSWKVYTYTVSGSSVIKHDPMKQVQADLARAFPAVNPDGASFFSKTEREQFARDPSWVDVVALHWLTSPERLLVLAFIPPSSGYGVNMGKRRGYLIDPLSGAILRSYTENEMKRLWGKYLRE